MMNGAYDYRVKGGAEADCLANIAKQVEARVRIVTLASQKKCGFGAGPDFHENSTALGVDVTADPLGYFNSINNSGTAIACLWATKLTFYGGIGTWELNSGVRTASGIDDFVPGDWGYIFNDANKTNYNRSHHIKPQQDPNWEPGLEGENVIYVGTPLKKFWGHFSATLIVQPWQDWFSDIREWEGDDGTTATPRLNRKVTYPTVGLEP
jgi:hypothetical protein